MNNRKVLCTFLSLNLGALYAQSYVDIEHLHQVTNLPHNVIQHWMNEFKAIEDWNEGSDAAAPFYRVFPRLINHYNFKKGCELGVSTGGHSYIILKTTNVEKLYSVDPYSPNYFIDFASKGVLELFFLRVKARLGQFSGRSELLRMYSLEASNLFKDNELDFVFIDADHAYESAKQDITLWYKKVRSGGIIGGDDYATSCPGVPKAVNEFFMALGLTVHQDKDEPRVWWVQKP